VELLYQMMKGRRKPIHLIVDGQPAHKALAVRAYIECLKGKLTLHFLPGYAPDLNPDELVWRYAKRVV
jgi:transposase